MLASCNMSHLAFVQDNRIQIMEPRDRSSVTTLPVTLRWEVNDFEVTGRDGRTVPDAGYFVVFVDRPPVPPGRTLEWLAMQEDSCGSEACGSVENLASVHVTEETTLELKQLTQVDERLGGEELHTVRIVLFGGNGARLGESAFRVQFTLARKG